MLRNADSRRRTTPWVSGLAVLLLAGFLVFRPYAWAQPPGEEAAGPSAAPAGSRPQPAAAEPTGRPGSPRDTAQQPVRHRQRIFPVPWRAAGGWCPSSFMSLVMVTVCDRTWSGTAAQAG